MAEYTPIDKNNAVFKRIPVDKYGPLRVTPPLSVIIIACVLLFFAVYGFCWAFHQFPVITGAEGLPREMTPALFRFQYFATLSLSALNLLLGIGLPLLIRPARKLTIVALALEFAVVVVLLIAKAAILKRLIIPYTMSPSASTILMTCVLCVIAGIALVGLGSMAVMLMDVDVVKVFEGRAPAKRA